jgi:predicted phosphodiesterase
VQGQALRQAEAWSPGGDRQHWAGAGIEHRRGYFGHARSIEARGSRALPETTLVDIADRRILVLHNLAELESEPRAAGIDVVISGHSHRPKIETRDDVLYVNPGSAGPRRFRLPVALARIEITAHSIGARIVDLPV